MIGEEVMIKYYCDKCGKEIADDENIEVKEGQIFHYCNECQYNALTCGFKIGDQVITDDGRVGTITDICTCEKCKERGFYEPKIKTEVGLYDIWITDTDKNNGFMSYYKIGDQVFGNVDEEEEERLKEDIHTRKSEIIGLEAQLNVLKELKEEKENEKSCQSNH